MTPKVHKYDEIQFRFRCTTEQAEKVRREIAVSRKSQNDYLRDRALGGHHTAYPLLAAVSDLQRCLAEQQLRGIDPDSQQRLEALVVTIAELARRETGS